MKLVAQVENLGGLMNMAAGRVGLMVGDAVAEIAQQVEVLRRKTQETGEDLRKMEQEQEAFAISYHECTKLNAHLQHLATQPQNQQSLDLEKKIRRYYINLIELMCELSNSVIYINYTFIQITGKKSNKNNY